MASKRVKKKRAKAYIKRINALISAIETFIENVKAIRCRYCGAIMEGDEWSIDSLMTQHKENYAKAGCEPLKRSDYDPFK